MESSDINSQVFKAIQELVTHQDFIDSQFQFYEQHKHTFQDSKENKLEYTQIYEAYVQILEMIIDSKLRSQFSDDIIQVFYQNFTQNFKTYESENKDTVDILMSFLDFQKFKESILKFKAGIQDFDQQKQLKGDDQAVIGIEDEQYFYQLINEDVSDKKSGWRKVVDINKKGLQGKIYQKKIEGSIFETTRAECVFEKVSLEAWDSFVCNIEQNMTEAQKKSIKEFVVIERDADGFPTVMYSRTKMPFMTDRDNLIKKSKQKLKDGGILYFTKTIQRDDYPEKPECIRMEVFKASKIQEIDGDLHLTEFSNFNLKGYVPVRLLNMALGSMMSKSLNDFYDQIQKIQSQKQSTSGSDISK